MIEVSNTDNVAPVRVNEQDTYPAGVAITPGQYVRINETNGHLVLADSEDDLSTMGGVALTEAKQAGDTVTFVRFGIVDLGHDALEDFDYGDPVFLSDTGGAMDEVPGTVAVVVGTVVPGHGSIPADRLLRVFPPKVVEVEE